MRLITKGLKMKKLILLVILLPFILFAQEKNVKPEIQIPTSVNEELRTTDYTSINEICMFIYSNGIGSHDPTTNSNGFYWPGGESASIPAVYSDGPMIGFKVNDSVRVYGAGYSSAFTPGALDNEGNPYPESHESMGIYKVRKNPGAVSDVDEREYMAYCEEHWPGQYGAPYVDNNNDGVFTVGVDDLDFLGDEMLYTVFNAANSTSTNSFLKCPAEKLEIQSTVFELSLSGILYGNVVFKNYCYINKSDKTFKDVYISYWMDTDLGNFNDDFVGCSPEHNAGYSYNGDNYDEDFYNSEPPAIAYSQIYGPMVPGNTDDVAITPKGDRMGYKNLPVTGFAFYYYGSSTYAQPDFGSYNGATQFYNNMQSKPISGSSYIDPNTSQPVILPLSGRPDENTGWFEGDGWPNGPEAGDRVMMISSGPFDMEPGDTQYVSYAIHINRGSDNINSVTTVLDNVEQILNRYGNGLTNVKDYAGETPESFSLEQNYPNPFNPTTSIRFSVPEAGNAKLNIYNSLGELVKSVVNKHLDAGNYESTVDMSDFASGMYIYRLTTNQYSSSKKMMLIK